MVVARTAAPLWHSLVILVSVFVLSYGGLAVLCFFPQAPSPGEMSAAAVSIMLFAFFLICLLLGMLSVVAGIGGGIIFTPVMMAFTPVNSVVVRATGLIIAMFSGLMSTGVFMKKGIGSLKMCVTLAVSQGIGALIGAQCAIAAANTFGDSGEGVIRVILGLLVAAISVYFITGGKKLEWPNIQNVDRITAWMKLEHSYFEESDNKVYTYKITRIVWGFVFLFLIGFLGGFYGIGAGWAITPLQNLVLGVPLKVATANSSVIIGMVDSVGVWPYILSGAIIPLFVLPWFTGQAIGGYIGALVFVRVKVVVVRYILIGIMVFTSFALVSDGLARLNLAARAPGQVSAAVFLVVLALDALLIFRMLKKKQGSAKNGQQANN